MAGAVVVAGGGMLLDLLQEARTMERVCRCVCAGEALLLLLLRAQTGRRW